MALEKDIKWKIPQLRTNADQKPFAEKNIYNLQSKTLFLMRISVFDYRLSVVTMHLFWVLALASDRRKKCEFALTEAHTAGPAEPAGFISCCHFAPYTSNGCTKASVRHVTDALVGPLSFQCLRISSNG